MKLNFAYRFYIALLLVTSLLVCTLAPVAVAIADTASNGWQAGIEHHTLSNVNAEDSVADVSLEPCLHASEQGDECNASPVLLQAPLSPLVVDFPFTVLPIDFLQVTTGLGLSWQHTLATLFSSGLRSHLALSRIQV